MSELAEFFGGNLLEVLQEVGVHASEFLEHEELFFGVGELFLLAPLFLVLEHFLLLFLSGRLELLLLRLALLLHLVVVVEVLFQRHLLQVLQVLLALVQPLLAQVWLTLYLFSVKLSQNRKSKYIIRKGVVVIGVVLVREGGRHFTRVLGV